MRLVAAGIYVAITLSFIRRIVRKACLSRKPGKPGKSWMSNPEKPGVDTLSAVVAWQINGDEKIRSATMKFMCIPTAMAESTRLKLVRQLSHPAQRILLEAGTNRELNGTLYRCIRINFYLHVEHTQDEFELPSAIKAAVHLSKLAMKDTLGYLVDALLEEQERDVHN